MTNFRLRAVSLLLESDGKNAKQVSVRAWQRAWLSRSHAHDPRLCGVFLCVLPHGFSSKRDTARGLDDFQPELKYLPAAKYRNYFLLHWEQCGISDDELRGLLISKHVWLLLKFEAALKWSYYFDSHAKLIKRVNPGAASREDEIFSGARKYLSPKIIPEDQGGLWEYKEADHVMNPYLFDICT